MDYRADQFQIEDIGTHECAHLVVGAREVPYANNAYVTLTWPTAQFTPECGWLLTKEPPVFSQIMIALAGRWASGVGGERDLREAARLDPGGEEIARAYLRLDQLKPALLPLINACRDELLIAPNLTFYEGEALCVVHMCKSSLQGDTETAQVMRARLQDYRETRALGEFPHESIAEKWGPRGPWYESTANWLRRQR